ncbi:hypothetical protein CAC42_725 [Sphaceloma murrayae]|uniref:SANT domain-containing protein n=1 Tax=Sphaceloma murrayae TaxID=2082308 RepID=A0A2K1QJZ9_9PEZI|nr:hypothetical protein CAC42_725 [Sphaceloma murrayae]
MSTQTSSAINKSGKVIAPKVAGRRRPAARAQQAGPSLNPPLTPVPSQPTQDDPTLGVETVTTSVTAPATSTGIAAKPHTALAEQSQGSEGAATKEHAEGGAESEQQTQPTEHDAPLAGTPNTDRSARSPQGEGADTANLESLSPDQSATPAARRQRKNPPQVVGTKRKRAPATAAKSAERITAEDDDEVELGSGAVEEATPAARPAKTARMRKPTKKTAMNATTQDEETANDAANESGPVPNSAVRKGTPRRKKSAQTADPLDARAGVDPTVANEDSQAAQTTEQRHAEGAADEATGTVQSSTSTSGPRPRPRKSRKARQEPTEASADAEQTQDQQARTEQHTQVQEAARESVAGVDDDLEALEIDIVNTAMSDLIREPKGGKTSGLERRMAEVDWDEVKRKRREMSPPRPLRRDYPHEDLSAPARNTQRLRLVNGEIVYDEASGQIDRQAQALAEIEGMSISENVDVTKHVNRMSWMNDRRRDPADRKSVWKMKSDPWNDDETDRFYDALRMFGTDFSIISKMFPPKTRRQIKLKFVREERLDPQRITDALSGKSSVKMDLNAYAVASGVEVSDFKDPTIVTQELAEEMEKQQEEIDKKKKEAQEAQKQRDIMNEQREKDKEGRDKEKAMQKEQREVARRRKRMGRGQVVGTGTF